jgi:hypothetical protein
MQQFAGTPFASATQGFRGSAFSSIPGMGDSNFLSTIKGQKGDKSLYDALIKKASNPDISNTEMKSILAEAKKVKPGGITGASTTAKLLGATALTPFLMGEEEPVKPMFTEEDYRKAYEEQRGKLAGGFEPNTQPFPTRDEVTGSNMFYANQGGLAEIVKKFNQGGINYLPSKIDHNENDVNNYVRAEGYVEDGAGAGDKDEDTMLAQLADGEFVSRADAVLGAGILSGADPKSFKGMRKAGADFFYNQQKQLKRIYDLVDGSKKN